MTALLTIAEARLPHWPRGLSLGMAASYVGVSPNTFLKEIEAGLWPKPERRGKRAIWDRLEIDAYWDRRRLGGTVEDDREALNRKYGNGR